MKKKVLSMVLCVVMAISVLSGCGGKDEGTTSNGSTDKQTENNTNDIDSVSLKNYEGADTPQEAMEAYLEAIKTAKEDYILKTLHPSYARLLAEYEAGSNKEINVPSFWDRYVIGWDSENMCVSMKKFDVEILDEIQYVEGEVGSVTAIEEHTEEQEKVSDQVNYIVRLTSSDEEMIYRIPVGKTVTGKWYVFSVSDVKGSWEAREEIAEEKDAKIATIQKYLDDISANSENSLEALSPLYVQIKNASMESGTVNGIDYEKLFSEALEKFEKKPEKLFEGGEIQEILWCVDGDQNTIGNIWGTNSIRETCEYQKNNQPEAIVTAYDNYISKLETRVAVTAQLRMVQGEDIYDASVNFYLVKYDGTWYVEDLGGLNPVK